MEECAFEKFTRCLLAFLSTQAYLKIWPFILTSRSYSQAWFVADSSSNPISSESIKVLLIHLNIDYLGIFTCVPEVGERGHFN